MAEFDALNALYDKFKDSSQFKFVSFTYENQASIEKVKAKYNIKFPVYSTVTLKECQRLCLGLGFPTNIILDKCGDIRHITAGGYSDKKKAAEFIRGFYPEISGQLKLPYP